MIFESIILGVHLASAHIPAPEGINNFNPGVYIQADGWTAGAYRNSYRRPSLYLGHTLSWGPASLFLGAVTGYHKPVLPLVAPSLAGPSYEGWRPRLTLIPRFKENRTTVLHLSVEKELP